MMNKILQNLINTEEVASFTDNVIVRTEEEEGHDKVVEEVIKRLAENDLYVKLEKCKWKVRKVKFLGVVIELEEIKMEEEKIKMVLYQTTSNGVKDVQKFLGLAKYYRQFVKDFLSIAKPLHNFVKKNQKWDQTEKQEKAFRELKERFTEELVLAAPDLDKMKIEVDAC